MNVIDKAGPAAIYNLLLYLLDDETAKEGTPLSQTLQALTNKDLSQLEDKTRTQFATRLNIVQQAFYTYPSLKDATITVFVTDYNNKKGGMKSCVLTDPAGAVHVVFAGTGAGEWIDNGEGLSGIPEYNLYEKYDKTGNLLYTVPAPNDYATDQQSEALNWYNKLCAQNSWDKATPIIVSGHSKGGNKAQFVAINSDLVTECYSFDGQGFSPEAIEMFRSHYPDYETRISKIYSISADNDYVNVLGERLAPEQNIFFLRSSDIGGDPFAYHYMETLLNARGSLNSQAPQDEISRYIQNLSDTIMSMPPEQRRHITLSIMSVFQHILGGGAIPVNGDYVSESDTVKGVISALAPTVTSLLFTKDGNEAAAEIAEIYKEKLGTAIHEKAAEILTGIFEKLKGQ
ncbi:MAG: DUF2974 domain-containing protein [Oscillospiraceae bacterium]|nr:DUF2974 domain-containing protein [Oscillospiraceae bacterium]